MSENLKEITWITFLAPVGEERREALTTQCATSPFCLIRRTEGPDQARTIERVRKGRAFRQPHFPIKGTEYFSEGSRV